MNFQKLIDKKLISPPRWMASNLQYLCITGSTAYGCATNNSDWDIYGWCIPHKEIIFPHLAGVIPGFGKQGKRFDSWVQHHIKDDKREYDFTVFNIIRFFQLCMDNNPDKLDSLFVPRRCILHCTAVGQMVRDARRIFLSKKIYHSYRGYSFSQMHKMKDKNPEPGSKREKLRRDFGMDVKFALHVVRLLLQCEQVLIEHDLDLERNSEILKSIRRGEWTEERIVDFFQGKEGYLEELYQKSDLRYSPDEDEIKQLLLNVLEHHFGNLEKAVTIPDKERDLLGKISSILSEAGY